MPEIIEITSEQQWLELKTQDISSTEVSGLFNMSPYITEFELYHLKKAGTIHTIEGNERTEWGKELEAAIASGVAKRYGLKVKPLKCYMRHSEVPRMGSSFDFKVVGIAEGAQPPYNKYQQAYIDKGYGILEIKNVDSLVYKSEWDADEAPPHIEFQVQHQMELTGAEWTMVAALVGGNKLEDILYFKNPEMGKAIVKSINEFWEKFDRGEAPQPNWERDAEAIIAMYKSAGGDPYKAEDLQEFNDLCMHYQAASAAEKDASKIKKEVKAKMLMMAGDAPSAFSDEYKVTMTEVAEKEGEEITPEMVGQFMGARKGYRLFRVSPIKKKK